MLAQLAPAETHAPLDATTAAANTPEDVARYVCGCGTAFMAEVTADVPCPACGDDQAW